MQTVSLFFVWLILAGGSSIAEETHFRSGFWGGIDIAAGRVEQSLDGMDDNSTNFYLGLKGGYTINPHFLVGIEFSGWLLEESDLNDPRYGEGISQIFLITRYYPWDHRNLFFRFGGGYVEIWNNRPGEDTGLTGSGLTFGAGYDILLTDRIALSPFLGYTQGSADEIDYNAVNFGIGFTFQ
jgi:hypothetical protein